MIADFAQVTNKSTGRTVTKVCGKQMPYSHTIFLYFLGRFCFFGRSIGTSQSLAVISLPLKGSSGLCMDILLSWRKRVLLYLYTKYQICSTICWGRLRESPITAFPIKC